MNIDKDMQRIESTVSWFVKMFSEFHLKDLIISVAATRQAFDAMARKMKTPAIIGNQEAFVMQPYKGSYSSDDRFEIILKCVDRELLDSDLEFIVIPKRNGWTDKSKELWLALNN